jgi:hypothetical protein
LTNHGISSLTGYFFDLFPRPIATESRYLPRKDIRLCWS